MGSYFLCLFYITLPAQDQQNATEQEEAACKICVTQQPAAAAEYSTYMSQSFVSAEPLSVVGNGAGPSTAVLPEVAINTYEEEPAVTKDLEDSVQFGPTDGVDTDNDTIPYSPPPNTMMKLRLHRGRVFEDLNKAIEDGGIGLPEMDIEVEMVEENGKVEAAEDTGGVLRDTLSEYWTTFHIKCTNQSEMCVPVIRHDMRDTWSTCVKVMCWGYKLCGYFPIFLSKPFVCHCLGHDPSSDELISSFKKMIPKHERDAVESGDFQSEDFMDFLEAHDVKSVPTPTSWARILGEVAHKEIIQEPAFIADCWAPVMKLHFQCSKAQLDEIYDKLVPSPRRVIKALSFENELSTSERSIKEYLIKFIRLSNDERLRRFLRFCTGTY